MCDAFLKHYSADSRFTTYAEFAYYIVVKYSITYADYRPLYDFSASWFGFYPTVKAILDNHLFEQNSLNDCLLDIEGRFRNENYIETFHQYRGKRNLLEDSVNELSFIAPTSFGKSSVIVIVF